MQQARQTPGANRGGRAAGYLFRRFIETIREEGLLQAIRLAAWRIERLLRWPLPVLPRNADRTPFDLEAQYRDAVARGAPLPAEPSGGLEVVRVGSASDLRRAADGSGSHVLLVFRDAVLRPGAEARFARAGGADLAYADEDRLDRTAPLFKPEYSFELHLASNYLGDVLLVRRALLRGIEAEGPHDAALAIAHAAARIVRIPEVLFSRAASHEDASEHAVRKALARRGRADLGIARSADGSLRVRYPTPEVETAVIIPTTARPGTIEPCLAAIERHRAGLPVEVLVVDTGTADSRGRSVLRKLPPLARVLRWPGRRFNYAAANNFAVRQTRAPMLLFLNDDTEPLDDRWLAALLEVARWSEVAIAGSLLLYPDRTIQHAGIVLGVGGPAGHVLRGVPDGARPNQTWALRRRDVSAVTGASMLVRRDAFEALGGFDESFSLAYNDVDLCLRARARGLHVIFEPASRLLHKESATRRKRHVPAEERRFLSRWGGAILRGDPFYSPNLTREREDLSLAVRSSGCAFGLAGAAEA